MRVFQKNVRPSEMGSLIYEQLRAGLQSEEDLGMEKLLSSLDLARDELDEQHVGEIMIGLMFGATLAVESGASSRAAELIVTALKGEFLRHLDEQGATTLQKAEWEAVLADRFLTYRRTMDEYTGYEPPWRLGRAFFWNLINEQRHIAMSVKICTLYMLAAREECQRLLNEYGPRLRMDPER